MTPGSIVFYKHFSFRDGGRANKLLILLNAGGARPYLVLRTTSQQRAGREAREGCHAQKGYYFLPGKRDNFPIDTWILLYEPYEVTAADFLKAHFGGDAQLMGCLKAETLRAIINCFKKTDDCSEHHESLLQ